MLHSLEEERDTSHDSTGTGEKHRVTQKNKNAHLEQLNQSTQSFDRGLGHGPLHRHVHVHGGFDDGADAVCVQDALRGRETRREDVEVSFVWSVYHEMSFFEDKQCNLGVVFWKSTGKSESAGFMYRSVGDANVIPHLHKHIAPAVKVFSQLVTFLLLGQDGLHLHHPGSYKHVVGLNISEEMRQQKESDSHI